MHRPLLRRWLLLCCVALVATPRAGRTEQGPVVGPAGPARPLRVLFIGNSLTYYDDVPALLAGLAREAGVALETQAVVQGGGSLEDHWRRGRALATLQAGGRWDFVVLQEHSLLGGTTLVEGRARPAEPDGLRAAAARFHAEAQRVGARTVLSAPWARRDSPALDARILDAHVAQVARELGALRAPLGLAMLEARSRSPVPQLYDPDGLHPAPAASYLSALVLYRVLLGRPPPTPRTLTGRGYDRGGHRRDGERVLVSLDALSVAVLSASAEAAVRAPAPYAVPVLPLPFLPAGAVPTPAQAAGVWRGRLKLFPHGAAVELRIRAAGAEVAGTVRVVPDQVPARKGATRAELPPWNAPPAPRDAGAVAPPALRDAGAVADASVAVPRDAGAMGDAGAALGDAGAKAAEGAAALLAAALEPGALDAGAWADAGAWSDGGLLLDGGLALDAGMADAGVPTTMPWTLPPTATGRLALADLVGEASGDGMTLGPRSLTFAFSPGPYGSVVTCEAVLVRGKLVGVARFVGPLPLVSGVGTFELTRVR